MKKRQWLKRKREKSRENKIQKKFLFTCVLESKIRSVYIRKKNWDLAETDKESLTKQTKTNNLKQKN